MEYFEIYPTQTQFSADYKKYKLYENYMKDYPKIAFRFSKWRLRLFKERNVLTVERVLTDCRLLRGQILPGLPTTVVTYVLIRA